MRRCAGTRKNTRNNWRPEAVGTSPRCEDYSLVEVRRLDSSSVSVHAHSFDCEQQVCVLPGTAPVSHETVTPVKMVHLDLADARADEAHQADRGKHLGAWNEY